MDIKTETCDGYVVTLVDGKVFSVKPLPQPDVEKKASPVDSPMRDAFNKIIDEIEETKDSIRKKRKAWGYGSHWYKDYVA